VASLLSAPRWQGLPLSWRPWLPCAQCSPNMRALSSFKALPSFPALVWPLLLHCAVSEKLYIVATSKLKKHQTWQYHLVMWMSCIKIVAEEWLLLKATSEGQWIKSSERLLHLCICHKGCAFFRHLTNSDIEWNLDYLKIWLKCHHILRMAH